MLDIELGFFDHLLLFILGILLPIFAVFQSQPEMKTMKFDTEMKKQLYYGNSIFQWICTLFIILTWWSYSRPFSDLGFQWGQWDKLAVGLLGLFLILYLVDVWWEIRSLEKMAETKEKWLKDMPILPVNMLEFKHFMVVALTAGVCEEIIFRGFFINYFLAINENDLFGQWLSVINPAFLFAFGHMYQGGKAVAKIMVMAVIFGWIYILTKSLLLLILIHFIVDVIGGYSAMLILKEPNKKPIKE